MARGLDRHLRRVQAATSQKALKDIGKAVYWGADQIRVEARRLIADGAVQGAGHVPSAPGEPPNWDTGELANKIVARQTGPLSAEAASTARYAVPLEEGTSRMAERPYMGPAARNKREIIAKRIGGVVSDAIRRAR